MASPRYTFLIANRNTGVVRRFTFVRRVAIWAVLGILAVPTLVGLGARWSGQAEIENLRVVNDGLRVENESYRTATGELATQINTLQSALTQLSERAQLDPAAKAALEKLPANVRNRAMGGGSAADRAMPAINAASGSTGTFGILRDLLGALDERLKSVRSDVEARQSLAAATPSIWPIASGWLASAFGMRPDPITGSPDFHSGLDISADRGTAVHATADGTVESAAFNGGYGNSVVLDHGFGISTRFGHLSSYAVKVGQKVKRNQVVGYVGSTGRTTGTHVHYEILINGQPVNPLKFLAR